MDRNELIDRIFAQGNQIRAVLQGLHTEHLKRINRWYESNPVVPDFRSDIARLREWEQEIKEWIQLSVFPKLSGEEEPYNVYLIEWDDGRGYVGMTGQSIITRMEQHFGQIHLDLSPATSFCVAMKRVSDTDSTVCTPTSTDAPHKQWRCRRLRIAPT